MNKLRLFLMLFLSIGLFSVVDAHKPLLPEVPVKGQGGTNSSQSNYRADCTESTSQTDLNVNNVRARLLGGGDMWWDFSNARYVVPNVPLGSGLLEVSSIYAGAIWLGGWEFDQDGNPANLKMAAQTYRSSAANDFWAGPLDANGGTDEKDCNNWDEHFEVSGEEITDHINKARSAQGVDCANVPNSIKGWPAKGNPFFASIYGFELPYQDLAPFLDENGDGEYNPCDGDFPIIEIIGCEAGEISKVSFADQMIWYVFNDNGGIHTRTTADPIRMEVQTLAFAYKTGDEVNDMTFYRYKLWNKSAITIDSTYFGQWVDADLGCPTDDFIGCDVDRSLMYIYNDGAPDGAGGCGSVPTYGNEVPMLGIDYFRGPKDENGVELGMSSFIYYVNGGWPGSPGTNDPTSGQQFYSYLSGSWRDGTPYTTGGNGYNSGGTQTNYVFPGSPDDPNGWSMCTEALPGADLRTVQASGPFQLQPGAINELIMGVVWVPDAPYPCPSLSTLLTADNLSQALYDNCFKITDGPDAPSIDIVELDKKLVILLTNDTLTSNNKFLAYEEKNLENPDGEADSMYVFEGYKLYQISGSKFNDLDNPDQARLIMQSDLNNDIIKIYNWEKFPGQPANVPVFVPELKVDGQNKGIISSVVVTEDQFAEGDRALVNHKDYYFVSIAYAYNNYQEYNPSDRTGQREAYLEGRRNVEVTTGIPRIPTPEFGGITLNSDYGDGAIITRLDGEGTGLNFLEISEESVADILDAGTPNPTSIKYQAGGGPIAVKVIDPIRVKAGTYTLTIFDDDLTDPILDADNAKWMVEGNGEQWFSEVSLNILNEQLLVGKDEDGVSSSLGVSVTLGQVEEPGLETAIGEQNGFIGATSTYADPSVMPWYQQVAPTNSDFPLFNYVPTGETEPYQGRDPQEVYKGILGGSWVPYTMVQCVSPVPGEQYLAPAWENSNFCSVIQTNNDLKDLRNIDIVLTKDKSKWSRCAVAEAARSSLIAAGFQTEGNRENMRLRAGQSLDKDGNSAAVGSGSSTNPNDPNYLGETGMSWFPGYAIDVETGRRVNIFFAENSVYRPDEPLMTNFQNQVNLTGGDMMWNPTSDFFVDIDNSGGPSVESEFITGGQHFVYVTSTDYDEGVDIANRLNSNNPNLRRLLFNNVIWTSYPLLAQGQEMLSMADGLVPQDVTFKLRVQNSYGVSADVTGENKGYPKYEFTLDGVAPVPNDATVQETALDLVNVVPNPYYAYSAYEIQNTDNTVKITNLPPECTVTIYSLDGKFIRKYERAEGTNSNIPNQGALGEQINASVDWDLKNSKLIPIASGVYLIHINAPGIGERTIKWFGIQRTFDTYRN
ncbi:MAG: hypothetical protein ACPGXZ_05105 [Saprospiraceae bacterium]